MKQAQTVLGVKIKSEIAEKNLANRLGHQADLYDGYALLDDEYYESVDQIMADLVH